MSNRRTFLKQAAASATALAIATAPTAAVGTAVGAGERIRLGVVGLSRGRGVAEAFKKQPDAEIAYLCDTDEQRLDAARKAIGAGQPVADLRRILDDPSVDAIVIATPDHWHAPATIRALEAGKHVYV